MVLTETYKRRLAELAGIVSEIELPDIIIPKELIKDTLNPALWDNEKLYPEVRAKLIEIAMGFWKELELETQPDDLQFVGGNASFAWKTNSDIDLHIIYNMNKLSSDTAFAKAYLEAQEKLWKVKHKIIIRGYPVEIYVQGLNEKLYSSGTFSLLKNKWERRPRKEKVEIDKDVLRLKIKHYADMIEHLSKKANHKSSEEVYALSVKIKNKLKLMRQCGLEKGGEYSIENLTYKWLRDHSYIQKIFEIINAMQDKKLSLPD